MKNILHLIAFAVFISCAKEKDTVSGQKISESTGQLASHNTQIDSINNPEYSGAFAIAPQDISPEQGRSVFTHNGKTLFYFDQNSNNGIIKIDGKDYSLDRYDFNENNYALFGSGVVIEAKNGDFKEMVGDCLHGSFPEVKVSLNGETLNLTNINIQDCPAY